MKFRHVLITLLILFTQQSWAQDAPAPNTDLQNTQTSDPPIKNTAEPTTVTATLKGQVFERGTRKKLASLNVFLLPAKQKSTTDVHGAFTFDVVTSEKCEIIINATGYKKYQEQIYCDATEPQIIYLERTSYTTFETTVTGKIKARDDQIQTLTQEEFLKAPGSFGGDPVRATQNLPGVAQNGASAQVIVQGAAPQDTGYLINGHRVPLIFHFGGLSSVIIPEAVERVDLIPAGYGPEYSRAQGGIIELTTKSPEPERTRGFAFVDLLNSGVLVQGPIDDKSSYLMSARYSYIGQVLKKVAEKSDEFQLTAAPVYYDSTSIYQRKLSERTDLKASFILSQDELKVIRSRADDSDPSLRGDFAFKTGFFRLIPQINTRLEDKSSMSHSLGAGRDTVYIDASSRYLDVESYVLSHRSEYVKEWHDRYKTYIGLDNQIEDYKVRFNLPNSYSLGGIRTPFSVAETRKTETRKTPYQIGAYLRQELKPSSDSRWMFSPNIRVDHFSVNHDTVLQPRLLTRYQLDPSLALRISVGWYTQAPLPQEADSTYGNPNIKSPKSTHYTAGWTKDFRGESKDGLQLTNNYFYKVLSDIVTPDISKNYSNSGAGEIKGTEIQAKYRSGRWSGQIVYTYLDSQRELPSIGKYQSEFDQTHNLNLIGALNLERWSFSARFRWVTGSPYTPVSGAVYDTDNDVYIPRRGALFSERFDDFRQVDIRIDRKFVADTWILSAYLDVQNLLNTENAQDIEYSYDYSQKTRVRGLPVLPTVGLKGEF